MKTKLINHLITILFIAFSAVIFPSVGLAQNTVKAEIKKIKPSLIGEWNATMEIKNGIKTAIDSRYVYDFLPNNRYKYVHVMQFDVGIAYNVIETGKWKLQDDNKTLILESDTSSQKRLQPYDLFGTQFFEQNNSTAFKIKRASGKDTAEYIYLRKKFNFKKSKYY